MSNIEGLKKINPEFKAEVGNELSPEVLAEKMLDLVERHFDNRENLGQGKAADVWVVEDIPELDRDICLKTTHDPKASVNSLKREFDLQEEFHEAVGDVPKPCMFVEAGGEDALNKRGFIVMERMPGMNLEEFILQLETNDEAITVEIYKQIVEDIKALIKKAHAKGLYHRDLHLRNIMVDSDNNYKVTMIDFGDATKVCAGAGDKEIYHEEIVRDGKPVTVAFPRDGQIIPKFSRAVLEKKVVEVPKT